MGQHVQKGLIFIQMNSALSTQFKHRNNETINLIIFTLRLKSVCYAD